MTPARSIRGAWLCRGFRFCRGSWHSSVGSSVGSSRWTAHTGATSSAASQPRNLLPQSLQLRRRSSRCCDFGSLALQLQLVRRLESSDRAVVLLRCSGCGFLRRRPQRNGRSRRSLRVRLRLRSCSARGVKLAHRSLRVAPSCSCGRFCSCKLRSHRACAIEGSFQRSTQACALRRGLCSVAASVRSGSLKLGHARSQRCGLSNGSGSVGFCTVQGDPQARRLCARSRRRSGLHAALALRRLRDAACGCELVAQAVNSLAQGRDDTTSCCCCSR